MDLRSPVRTVPHARVAAAALLGAAVAAGLAVRFAAAGPLWFDEAQSVAIARLPVPHLFAALRQDGSPPFYYLLLHAWIGVFGTGTTAVRAFSGACGVLAVPALVLLARRLVSGRAAVAMAALAACSPFAIRYALEVRMYSLELLLVALAGLALVRVLERPRRRRVAYLALATSALALTHYWALFLIAATAAYLLPGVMRGERASRRALIGILGAAAPFLLWLPSMLFQVRHTGTPWGHAAPYDVLMALPAFGGAAEWAPSGWVRPSAALLTPVLFVLAGYGTWRFRRVRPAIAIATIALVAGGLASFAMQSAVTPRYLTVALPGYLLAAAAALVALPRRAQLPALIAVSVLGVAAGYGYGTQPRTLAGPIAAALRAHAQPNQAVAVCPDQFAPELTRELGPRWKRLQAFPHGVGTGPGRVNWVDYEARYARANPAADARRLIRSSGMQPIWLVVAHGAQEVRGRCGQLERALTLMRGAPIVFVKGDNPMSPDQSVALEAF